MLYLIGLGLGDAKDISVRGLEVVKSAKKVFLEAYTSILAVDKNALEELYGREVILADRDLVEQQSALKSINCPKRLKDKVIINEYLLRTSLQVRDVILADAKNNDIAFLVVGDPFGATTHTDLVIRARQLDIPYKTLHNASILNAIGCCGLQLYNYGETVSIVFWTDEWKPDSFYDKIALNRQRGLHTLCLLDIKVKEQTIENMMRGNKIYEPPRYMSVSDAVKQLIEIPKQRNLSLENAAYNEETLAVGLARIGSDTQQIVCGSMKDLAHYDLGPPLHSLVIPGEMHFLEKDMLKEFAVKVGDSKLLD